MDKTNPDISILIPCYNSEKYIAECLESCVKQSFKNWEIILIDDGSNDRSFEIAQEYENKYNNIHVYRQENSGACKARNKAFSLSKGQYIMYLDADDLISQDFLSTQFAAIQEFDDIDVALCRWDCFTNNITEAHFSPRTYEMSYNHGIDLLFALWNQLKMVGVSCYLVKRNIIELVGPWIESLKKNQDGEFFCRVLLNSRRIKFNPKAKFYYRRGLVNSISADNNPEKVKSILESLEMNMANALAIDQSFRARQALSMLFSDFIYAYYGKFPILCRRAKKNIECLGIKCPCLGPPRFQRLCRVFGYYNMLRFRKLILNR